jgi:hypothetical protein
LQGRDDEAQSQELILPALCHLSRKVLQSVINEIFKAFNDTQRRALTEEWRFLMARDAEHLSLATFVERLAALKYDAHVLLSRKTASLAYRFLVAAVGSLGPVPELNRLVKRDEDYYRRQLDLLRRAVRAFVGIFQPDCYTAFFLNGRLNRVCSLFEDAPGQDGLRFPEALTDCAWRRDDLPVQLLFDEGENLIYPPFPTQGDSTPREPATKRAFERREGVDPRRVLAFRLTWGSSRSRAAIILNWRKAGPSVPPAPGPDQAGRAPPEENESPGAWMKKLWAEV